MSPSRSRNQTELDNREYGPTRTQQRRDALAVLALAQQLVDMPPNRLAAIELPDEVRAEIANVRRIHSHIAHQRQLAFLAKLMRRHEPEAFDAARAALGENRALQRQETATMQRLEALREKLLGNDEALHELIEQYPGLDRQHLRSLIRQARAEQATPNKPPRAYREIFQVLKALGSAPSGQGLS